MSGSANIDTSKNAFHADDHDEDHDDYIKDYWIEDKFRGVGFEDDCDDIEIETPLDLSLRKAVR